MPVSPFRDTDRLFARDDCCPRFVPCNKVHVPLSQSITVFFQTKWNKTKSNIEIILRDVQFAPHAVSKLLVTVSFCFFLNSIVLHRRELPLLFRFRKASLVIAITYLSVCPRRLYFSKFNQGSNFAILKGISKLAGTNIYQIQVMCSLLHKRSGSHLKIYYFLSGQLLFINKGTLI